MINNTFKAHNNLGYDMLILSFTNNALLKSKVVDIFNGLELTQTNNEQINKYCNYLHNVMLIVS